MGKNKNNPRYQSIDLPNGTIIEQFKYYLKHYGNKVSNIIGFLHIVNSDLLAAYSSENISEAKKKEIVDFYHYFMDRYDVVTFDARRLEWGTEPLVFNLAEYYEEQFLYKKQKAEIDEMPEDIRKTAESLAEKLIHIKGERMFIFYLMDAEGNEFSDPIYVEKDLSKEDYDMVFTFLTYDCAVMMVVHGAMTALIERPNMVEKFGVVSDFNGGWRALSAQEMLDADTLCDDGTRLEPEDDVRYIEFI